MNNNTKFYFFMSFNVISFAYCFDGLLLSGIIVALIGLILTFYFSINKHFGLSDLIIWGIFTVLFQITNIEYYYEGFKIISFINIISSVYINRIFEFDYQYENRILKMILIYMLIILFILLIHLNYALAEIIAVSAIILPLVIQFYLSRVRIISYKEKRYDSIFNKQIH